MPGTIAYFQDPLGITDGYRSLFAGLLHSCGIPVMNVQLLNVHTVVQDAIIRRGNELEKVVNPEKFDLIKRYVDHVLSTGKYDLIVTSDPATLAVFNYRTPGADKISLTRGSHYVYEGKSVLVVSPIAAMHRQQSASNIDKISGDGNAGEADVYKIKDGHWFLTRDWSKVGRYYNGKTRKFPDFQYSVVRHRIEFDIAKQFLDGCALLSIDCETTGSHDAGGHCISCIGFTGLHRDGRMHTYVIPFADKFKSGGVYWDDDASFAGAWNLAKHVLESDIPKVMQNGAYDSAYFVTYGIGLKSYVLDTMHMWHSLYPELEKSLDIIASIWLDNYAYWKQDLKGVSEEKGGRKEKSMERFWRYNGLDCYYTLCSSLLLLRLVQGIPAIGFNFATEFVQMLVGLNMTLRGIKADFPRREELRGKLQKEYDSCIQRFRKLIDDPDFNINSSQQKTQLLYDLLGASPRASNGKLIRGGGRKGASAGKYALKMIKSEHPFLRIIVDAMESSQEPLKQISNICDMKIATSRMRSTISPRTETWRFSSSSSPFWDGTNMQNIRKSMRDWMVADEGCIMFDVDYSQSDAVFVAYESNDAKYIETMTCGKDSHGIHAEFFFKMPYDEIIAGKKADDPKITHPILGIRNITKRIVHGANFQMAGGTLYVTQMGKEATIATARYLGYPNPEKWTEDQFCAFCQRMLDMFRNLYPRLSKKGWYGEIEQQLIKTKMITNAFGMTRTFVGNPKDPGTQREATAFLGQSGTSGNINRALEEIMYGYIPPRFRDGPNEHAKERPLQLENPEYGVKTLLQVHDSLVGQISTQAPRWKEALHNILTVMERPVTINGHRVIVKTEAEIGLRWGKKMIPWKSGDPYDLDRITLTR